MIAVSLPNESDSQPHGSACPVCDAVVVRNPRPAHSGDEIRVPETIRALVTATAAGDMHVLRADVPLHDMLALAESERKYTIVCFLACRSCHATKFWGLHIRGNPVYRTVARGSENSWNWQPVPPRRTWAR